MSYKSLRQFGNVVTIVGVLLFIINIFFIKLLTVCFVSLFMVGVGIGSIWAAKFMQG
jgi:hypothetical protein